ncbi:hypothetical protein XENTR_v10008852 [Xenopus tropicalis]|nr:hypothetical protein XENTR_v10008852 [Xenopus tropicalis]
MYTCVNNSGVLKWKTEKDLKCIKKDGTTTSDQSMELEEKQHNHTDICAPLPHIPNARLTFVKVPVGQELHYMNKGTRANITQKCITENASGKYLGKESTTQSLITSSTSQTTRVVVAGGMLGVVAFILLFSVVG